MLNLSFLPKEGVCGTLYLYMEPQAPPVEVERWSLLNWDGKRFHTHETKSSILELRAYADTLLWAKDWPRVECCSHEVKINPCVRVTLEFKDGRTQSLVGKAADDWLKEVNGIVTAQAIRYGQSQMGPTKWEFSYRDA